jgi:hypothetical protein
MSFRELRCRFLPLRTHTKLRTFALIAALVGMGSERTSLSFAVLCFGCPDNLRWPQSSKPHLQPADVAIEVLCIRATEWLDKPAVAGVERVFDINRFKGEIWGP